METTDEAKATEVPPYKAKLEELCRVITRLYPETAAAMVVHPDLAGPAHLRVTHAHNAHLTEEVYCRPYKDVLWFFWSWDESIGKADGDLESHARVIGNVLELNRM